MFLKRFQTRIRKERKFFSIFFNEKDHNHFSKINDWWDPSGSLITLHYYNDLRIKFFQQTLPKKENYSVQYPFSGLKFLDVGCGGGILSEVFNY